MLCEKCGLPITGLAGRCTHCDPMLDESQAQDTSHGTLCSTCSAPLAPGSSGMIICTGCLHSEGACGCGETRPNPNPSMVSQREPPAEWWLRRLKFQINSLSENEEGLNRDGMYLLKFALYSTFIDLAGAALKQDKRPVYDAAVALLSPGVSVGS